jgi:predicted RNase H-like HicB family nuclease
MTTRYELIIYWSNDDESFVVEVPELPGCMADGQTYADAVANTEVVIEEWIAVTQRNRARPGFQLRANLGARSPSRAGSSPTRDLVGHHSSLLDFFLLPSYFLLPVWRSSRR